MTGILGIRRAMPSDVNEIYQLIRMTFEALNAKDYSPEVVRIVNAGNSPERILQKMLGRDAFCLIKSTREEEIILGTVDIKDDTIGGLFVRWDYIGKGCGTVLMDFIEGHAQERGVQIARLSSTKYARKFYLARGYQPQGDPELSLDMEKTLN